AAEVTAIFYITPEIQWHGRYGLGADQFAHRILHGAARLIPCLHSGPQHAALHLPGVLRQLAIAANKGATKVRAARQIVPPQMGGAHALKLLGAPSLYIRWQR